jgi:hypothetical protein
MDTARKAIVQAYQKTGRKNTTKEGHAFGLQVKIVYLFH